MLAVYLTPVYVLVNVYIILRTLYWLRACTRFCARKSFKIAFICVYIFLAISPAIGTLLSPGIPKRIFKLIGNYWLGELIYILLFTALADLVRLICKKARLARKKEFHTNRFRAIAGGVVAVAVVAMSTYGVVNAHILHTAEYEVTVEKACAAGDLNVVLVADTHLGYNISTRTIANMVDRINALEPDIVCFAGDFFDNEYEAMYHPEQLIELFKSIKSKYGTYACWGNHDIEEKTLAGFTFGGEDGKLIDPRMRQFVLDAGITLLTDESVLVDNAFYVVGRRDAERPGNQEESRLSPAQLVSGLDMEKPVIVIDHEPRELQALADAGVDIDLCGHTHNGQVFPGNLVIKLAWENACGYLKKDNMHNIVTSGVGLYGPNMRTFTDSEIAQVRVHFSKAA